jgi:nitroreductase
MDLFDVIKTRRSVRSFSDAPVSDDLIRKLLEAAMLAPSAGNQQPWHFVIVREPLRLSAVPDFHPYCKMIADASVAIVVCGDPVGKKWPDFWVQDCSAAVQNLLLAARAEGLGSVWTGVYPIEERMQGCRELFMIPPHILPFAIIPLGWPREENCFKEFDRFKAELVHHEYFE